jgi:hypothetical protein
MPLKEIWPRCSFDARCLNAFQRYGIGGPALLSARGRRHGYSVRQLRSCPSLRWLECAASGRWVFNIGFSLKLATIPRLVGRADLLFIPMATRGDKR